ncbi:hypothetical protein SLEP1_g39869 [Rubroshorea leprosula]|uniref:Uncharacterized protein n=1 Tax=Rubroshorea leprosula TaxID=152421 RepID=A0AAV5L1K7_9ROSI|nr:hypothetical protein SLEP1_g39869 [Rubroshorea leprosula]
MASIPLVLGFEFEEISEEQMSFTVAGRIVVVNPIHGDKVYWVLAKAWANCHDFQVNEIEENFYTVSFMNEYDLNYVPDNAPWAIGVFFST